MRALRQWLVVVAFVAGVAGSAWAGVEPSPLTPGTNVLNSVVNVLWEADGHLLDLLHPPEPGLEVPPNPCLANELDAVTKQLEKQHGRVAAVLEMVEGESGPPTAEFVQALLDVRTAAVGDPDLGVAGIAGDTGCAGWDGRPDPEADPVGYALYGVYLAALDIGDTVDGYLEGRTGAASDG
jgi:hypothetical protein